MEKEIIIPYCINLTNLESGSGGEGSSYTLAITDTLNTYTGSHGYFNLENNVLFQYFDTGVSVYIKQEDSNYYTSCLFEILI
jgi:hypothetical protein